MFRDALSVPASQAENEHAFSTAGLLSALRRSNNGDECLDDISLVHGNFTPDIAQELGLEESQSVAELLGDAWWEELRHVAPGQLFPLPSEELLENVE